MSTRSTIYLKEMPDWTIHVFMEMLPMKSGDLFQIEIETPILTVTLPVPEDFAMALKRGLEAR